MSYVNNQGLPMSSSSIGALTSSELSAADKAFKKAVPAGVWDFLKSYPLLPQNVKDSLVAKPVTTMLGFVTSNRNFWIAVINKSAQIQGRYGKAWTFVGVSPVTFKKMTAHKNMQEVTLLKMWLALSYANPLASITAIIQVAGKVASKAVTWIASQLMIMLGLKQGPVKGLGALATGTVTAIAGAVGSVAAAGAAAAAAVATATATISVTVLDKAFPDADTATAAAKTPYVPGGRMAPVPGGGKTPYVPGGGRETYVPGDDTYLPGGSGTQSADEGGLPGWLLPVGLGLGGLAWWFSRKKRS